MNQSHTGMICPKQHVFNGNTPARNHDSTVKTTGKSGRPQLLRPDNRRRKECLLFRDGRTIILETDSPAEG